MFALDTIKLVNDAPLEPAVVIVQSQLNSKEMISARLAQDGKGVVVSVMCSHINLGRISFQPAGNPVAARILISGERSCSSVKAAVNMSFSQEMTLLPTNKPDIWQAYFDWKNQPYVVNVP